MAETITATDFHLPGQVGEAYHGKVADTYTIARPDGNLFVAVRTDRISAFDVVLPRPIPVKGQVLNEVSAELLQATEDVTPNWLLSVPDPNVSIGRHAEPIKVEMIMRAIITGSAWKNYGQGMRDLCGNALPDGMREFDSFDLPLLTPTTKAVSGHDENITPYEIVQNGLATYRDYDTMAEMTIALFAKGQEMAEERGLKLGDTKIEFGKLPTGEIVVIDEVLNPDSSRYYQTDEFNAYLDGTRTERPQQYSKEYVREWLKAQGFTGEPGQEPPYMPDDITQNTSLIYISVYERMLGRSFQPPAEGNPVERIRASIVEYLAEY